MRDRLVVAAVQPESFDDDPLGNLDRAAALVWEAVKRGAKLVLCPELLATGNRVDYRLWRYAEAFDGPTVEWLREMATSHRILVGASFLEAVGGHFLNCRRKLI